MDEVAAKLEHSFSVVGCTAIEDRLQDNLPNTIADLRLAGIKVWVLTGDKMATAVNIGYSCRLLDPDMYKIVIKSEEDDSLTELETAQNLNDLLTRTSKKLQDQVNKLHTHFEKLADEPPPLDESMVEKSLSDQVKDAAKSAMPCLGDDDDGRQTPLLDENGDPSGEVASKHHYVRGSECLFA